ncbi:MAG TPA: hypothetical protein PLY87_05835 [Planctomycetaceae bacterium]|nr:hypothetical protein [Planctomycetaceae bacterium]
MFLKPTIHMSFIDICDALPTTIVDDSLTGSQGVSIVFWSVLRITQMI